MRRAACRGLDPELFFPNPGQGAAEARAVCATCPVKQECYEAGRDEHFGVWGGTTSKERMIANKGHTSWRVPVRGCWQCGLPTEAPHRYCSDWCRAEARRASSQRYWLKKKREAEG